MDVFHKLFVDSSHLLKNGFRPRSDGIISATKIKISKRYFRSVTFYLVSSLFALFFFNHFHFPQVKTLDNSQEK